VVPHVVAEAVIDEDVRGQKWPEAERQSNVFLERELQARGNLRLVTILNHWPVLKHTPA
jgi:hypothetical protein